MQTLIAPLQSSDIAHCTGRPRQIKVPLLATAMAAYMICPSPYNQPA